MLPPPVITEHDGFLVVRDDLLPGGTKRRAIHVLFGPEEEYVYASPVYGYAQLALAYAAKDHGKRATIFCARRKQRHARTLEAEAAGATIIDVPNGYLNVVRARAWEYVKARNDVKARDAVMLPFGLNEARFVEALADVARALPVAPAEVWTVLGSGTLSRALQAAWPEARFFGVRVGAEPCAGRARIMMAPEAYEKDAVNPPPFPSCSTYDAKCWQYVKKLATPGALVWNM